MYVSCIVPGLVLNGHRFPCILERSRCIRRQYQSFNDISVNGTERKDKFSAESSVKSRSCMWAIAASNDARKYPISPVLLIGSMRVLRRTPTSTYGEKVKTKTDESEMEQRQKK